TYDDGHVQALRGVNFPLLRARFLAIPVQAVVEKPRSYKCWAHLISPLREPCSTAEIRFPICLIHRRIAHLRSASFSRRFICSLPLLRYRMCRFRCLKPTCPFRSGKIEPSRCLSRWDWRIDATISQPNCLAEK